MRDFPSSQLIEQQIQDVLSSHPCYQHYIRISDRICRSLDFFGVHYDRRKVHQVLRSFYLFIGIVDHAMDTISLSIGLDILHQLKEPCSFQETFLETPHKLATELLKTEIRPEIYNQVLNRFSSLCDAVFSERYSKTASEYINHRKRIGFLTAEISYLLIEPFLFQDGAKIRKFFCNVGEVGCLIDSLIDLRADYERSLIGFRPSLGAYVGLLISIQLKGIPLLLRYPQLIQVFFEAVADNLRDFKR